MTKEYIIEAYERLKKKLGRQPGLNEFYDQTNVTSYQITKTFRTYNQLVSEMGDVPKSFSKDGLPIDEFMISYGKMVRELRSIPTYTDWLVHDCKPAIISYREKFGLKKFSDMAMKFYEYSKDIKDWNDIIEIVQPVINQEFQFPESTNEECYVYLMLDTKTKLYKIGLSNTPEWREKTLQSEKPSIKLIVAKKFVNRRMASIIEKGFHGTYSHKNKRGEWFLLDDEDVYEIKETLRN